MSRMIQNPILKGFNPDPSIIRVNKDYYIATSTFDWFPGVQIHHSRDLVNWRLLTRPLDRLSQLDLRGIPNSGGIWAPCLTYHDDIFYLCYTIVQQLNGVTKDAPNYLVTAKSITGPWSEPVFINSSGFDPSLYHAEDGRKWWLNMVWDHRPGKHPFYGIHLQEYLPDEKRLTGQPELIFKGTELGCTEGPHIYRRNGYYYLVTAEGGTKYEHAVTVARSRSLTGPYEVHPGNPLLTAWGDRSLPLAKTGHADLVETEEGDWYMVYLCARPLPGRDECILGRETAIQRLLWKDDDWPYLEANDNRPQLHVRAPNVPEHPFTSPPARDDFDRPELNIHYQFPRTPLASDQMSLAERPGHLRLRGGQSLESRFGQVMVVRRQQAFRYQATTKLEFEPDSFQQMAGLVCYYSTRLYHFCYMTHDERAGTCLYIQTLDNGEVQWPMNTAFIPLNNAKSVFLRAQMDYDRLAFFYSFNGQNWRRVADDLDSSILSDDYATEWGFTGAFVGLACLDLSGQRKHADFDFFEYLEHEL